MDTNLVVQGRCESLRSRLRHRGWHAYVGWSILIAYTLLLVYRACCGGTNSATANASRYELLDPRWFVQMVGRLLLRACKESAYFVPVGFIAAVVVPRGSGWLRRLPVSVPGLVIAEILAILVYTVKTVGSRHMMADLGFVFPLLGCLLGTWTGTTWLRGWRARFCLLAKATALVLLALLGAGAFVRLLLEEKPLPFEVGPVTSAEKRRLVRLLEGKSPDSLQEDQTHALRLTERDLNILLSWGFSFGPTGRKATVSLDHGSVSLLMSMATSLRAGRPRYLNLEATGGAGLEDGILRLHVDRCRTGSVQVPSWLLCSFSSLLSSWLNRDRRARPFLDATKEIVIQPDSIQLTYGYLDLPGRIRESLVNPLLAREELLVSTRAQVDCLLLLATVGQLSDWEPSFALCLKTAFALARDRSLQRDPVTENQAAIFALGVLVGHPRIEKFLGPVVADPDENAQQVLRRVAVHGRLDWARHFCVGAAITLLSDEIVSDAAGQLKEELDAEENGSGFSFADLLADRAGVVFAVAATRDEAAARTMQNRLAGGFHVEEIFPPADDLPEGISDVELESRYGGVGGEGYRRLTEELERRITECPAYQ